MSEPMPVGAVLPGVLAEVVDRAGHGYDRWAELVAQAGYCHHPVRLAGRVEQADPATGELRTTYDSGREPDGVLLKACGTRRESRCPSCAAVYRADAHQLLAAGLKGGKGVPDTVSEHPRLFVTFTAPASAGVHTRKAQGRLVLPCHPHRQGARCPHGTRAGCWHRHEPDDPRLGEPLCPGCYDAQAQVLWNALAPELRRRTTIAVQRALGRLVGLREGELRRLVRVSYAKVTVDRAYGGQGLGAELLDWAGTKAADEGADWLRVDVWTTNERLQHYYLKQGLTYVRTVVLPHNPSGALFQRPAERVPTPRLEEVETLTG